MMVDGFEFLNSVSSTNCLVSTQNAFMDEATLDDVKDTLKPIKLVNLLRWLGLGIGIVFILIGVVCTYKGRKSKSTA